MQHNLSRDNCHQNKHVKQYTEMLALQQVHAGLEHRTIRPAAPRGGGGGGGAERQAFAGHLTCQWCSC